MKLTDIITQIDTARAVVNRWNDSDAAPRIEKDILLATLQDIYKQVLELPSQAVMIENNVPNEPREEIQPEKPIVKTEFRMLFGQSVSKEDIDNFIRELFWRDEQFFAAEVTKLSQFHSVDEALIYISEKYNWNAQSAVAEQFTALLLNYTFDE